MTLLERLNDGGEVFLTHTTVGGSAVLRVAVGSPATTRAHVERVWALLCEAHDWLATDFAAAAAERAAEKDAERAAAEQARVEAEAATAAEAPVEEPPSGEGPSEEELSPSTTG
jgi:aromatic-L-amino-acid decarboxylase